jgi:hypothetical protein
MRCIRPLKASFDRAGDITYSSKKSIPGLVPLEFECRKCLPCRLNIAREKAIRATHEAKMHEDSLFLTLTYDEEHLTSDKLVYEDFQKFMKSLRERETRGLSKEAAKKKYISYMVTGEYGDKNKRPHWHALIFNYWPDDAQLDRTTDLDHKVWRSATIDALWKRGRTEFGTVTLDSANYVARYAAKKLVHGNDQEHDYHPIHKTSSQHAIGKRWIERYYKHTFQNGFVVLPNGQISKIPRYYVDWCKKEQPELWKYYQENVLPKIIKDSEKRQRKEEMEWLSQYMNTKDGNIPIKRKNVKETILKQKFKRLQENLKL